jgi:hypothetical protein
MGSMATGAAPGQSIKDVFSLSYVSRAARDFSMGELDELIRRARAFNKSRDISGLLYYRPGIFVQCIEGPQGAVEMLADRIASDPRHSRFTLLRSELRRDRSLPGSPMLFAHYQLVFAGMGLEWTFREDPEAVFQRYATSPDFVIEIVHTLRKHASA